MKHAWDVPDKYQDRIRHLSPELKLRVRQAFDGLASNPLLGKSLGEDLDGYRSYRVGRMRIVYQVHARSLFLVTLGPRKTVYQEAILELKRRLDKNH